MRTVLYTLAETIRNLALLTQPFMPTASGAILDQLAVAEASRSFATAGQGGRLGPGTALPKPAAVFPRHIDADAQHRKRVESGKSGSVRVDLGGTVNTKKKKT